MEEAGVSKSRNVNRRKNQAGNDKKTKARIIAEDKWEGKKYLQECDSDTIKDMIEIRLHMSQVNCNCKRDNTDTKCSLFKKPEDTTEHVLECEKAKKFILSKENSNGKWEEITEIYRKNKKNRKLAVVKVKEQNKIIKGTGKREQNKKNKREQEKNVEN